MPATVFTLDSKLTFGMHKGSALSAVIEQHPDYVAWCVENIEWFELDEDADQRLELELSYQECD